MCKDVSPATICDVDSSKLSIIRPSTAQGSDASIALPGVLVTPARKNMVEKLEDSSNWINGVYLEVQFQFEYLKLDV